nr:immunoglobulin light chain junction region [Macaca mulatta]
DYYCQVGDSSGAVF